MNSGKGTMALLAALADALDRLNEIESLIQISDVQVNEDGTEEVIAYSCDAEKILDIIRREYDGEDK
jgi:hypothetical protein